jgi:hypothetical protein
MRRTILLTLVAVTALAACDRAAETDLTTTTTSTTSGPVAEEPTPETTAAAPETTVASGPETTAAGTPVGDYTIEVAASEGDGEVLWVSIAAEDYTDRDLEDFVARVRDERENLVGLYVVDDPAAVDAVRVAEEARTEEEQALVDAHYLVSLTEGNVVTFRGPFESAGSFVLGS